MQPLQSPLRSKCWAVILAGGRRSFAANNIPTQYLSLAGSNVVKWATEPFLRHPGIEAIVAVVARDDLRWQRNGPSSQDKPIWVTQAGERRCDSCLSGLLRLKEVAEQDDWVIVHDATRPCLRVEDLDRFLHHLAGDDTGGAMGVPLDDPIKSQERPGVIRETVSRRLLWAAQTPQMFRYKKLMDALSNALHSGISPEDEAHAMELAGHRPKILEGSCSNLKLTCSQHLALAESVLGSSVVP